MILAAALLAAALHRDGESVTLRRTYLPGDKDSYTLRISPPGQASPLDNASPVLVQVNSNGLVNVVGEVSTYQLKQQLLATWRPNDQGNAGVVQATAEGFGFMPYVFTANDAELAPGEIEVLKGGSAKLISVKDSVAQLRVWIQVSPEIWLDERSDIEIATRRPNQIRGTIYRKIKQGLTPVRTFLLQRIRSDAISPIPQDDGDQRTGRSVGP